VSLQMLMVVGMLCVAAVAVATGSVLLLGYASAAVMFALILALMIRRVVRHHVGHRLPRGLSLAFRRESRDRRAVA
jgi:hypothetical protein